VGRRTHKKWCEKRRHSAISAIGLADRNTLAGVVRAHIAARELACALLPGARLVTQCGFEVIAYPHDRAAYGALSQCLTRGNRRAGKGQCLLYMTTY
jgi:error-prone DNA polymerase